MNTYKYDTHVHTSETSPCGRIPASQMVHIYKEAGYRGVVVTDHYFGWYFDSLGDLKWEDKVEHYLEGYHIAVTEGRKAGLAVILGMELRFDENENDYLIYGIDEAFLKENPELYKMGLHAFSQLARDKGLLVYQAHPFRPMITPADPSLLDGVEVLNTNPRHDSQNHKALAFAQANGLKKISGSDFHQMMDAAQGGIILTEPVETSKDFAALLAGSGELELIIPEE